MLLKKILAGALAANFLLLVGCQTELEPNGNSDAEQETVSISEVMETATLLYPAENELFYYNVYDTYVAVTKYLGDETIENIKIPDMIDKLPVYAIGDNAFRNSFVKTVEISKNVCIIGEDAFRDCLNLEKVTFTDVGKLPEGTASGNGVVEIGEYAFEGCENLKEITLPDSVELLGVAAFTGCTSLEAINVPSLVSEIPNDFCSECENLKEIYISSSVIEISDNAFEDISPDARIYGEASSAAAEFAAEHLIFFTVVNEESDNSTTEDTSTEFADDTAGENTDESIGYTPEENIDERTEEKGENS